MNQNNFQGNVRQITPEEIERASAKPMSHEELQKTQVLNLQEVEKVARFEKMTSKKPAIIVAIIGALFLTFGTTFQIASSLSAKKDSNIEHRKIQENLIQKPKETIKIPSLKCVQKEVNLPDGTDTTFTVTYDFDEEGLIRFQKVFEINPTPGSPLGATTIQSYINAYKSFMNITDGYQIVVVPNMTGLVVTVDVDYDKLDLTLVSPIQATHKSTSIDFPMGTSKENLAQTMPTLGFTCE